MFVTMLGDFAAVRSLILDFSRILMKCSTYFKSENPLNVCIQLLLSFLFARVAFV